MSDQTEPTTITRPEVPLPDQMKRLPVDKHGRPIPWFVATIDGVPDFRVIRPGGIQDAVKERLCWVCGHRLGKWVAFVVGPMCAVNRTSGEPPAHRDCAIYSARACPFLSTPNMRRRTTGIPEETITSEYAIARNPGVALVWVTRDRDWYVYTDPNGMPLCNIGKPDQTYWYAHGRDATRDEVTASIETGLPALRQIAADDGPDAAVELETLVDRAMKLVPA